MKSVNVLYHSSTVEVFAFLAFVFPDDEKMATYVADVFFFQSGVLTKRGLGRNGIFDGRHLVW